MAPFQEALVENLPRLRAFAQFLARDRALADDLVQETVLRALRNSEKFAPGTNMKAWLATILRNQFYNELRTRSRMAALAEMPHSAGQEAEQDVRLDLRDFERAFRTLPPVQRDALSLVAAQGFSYDEAAEIVGCAQGTVKSRVSRGRSALERALGRTTAGAPTTEAAASRLSAA